MLKKTIILLVLLMVVVFALDHLFYFGLSHNLNLKSTYAARGNNTADILVLGPCEPLFTVDPAYIQQKTGKTMYNLSLNHSDFADNFLHLYLYLKNNPAPEYLFLYATPESFDTRFNTFHAYRFAPFLSDSTIRAVVAEQAPDYVSWMNLPLLRYAYFNQQLTFPALQGIKHWTENKKAPYFTDGHQPHPSSRSLDNPLHFEVQLDEYGNRPEDPTYKKFEFSSKREKYFGKIIQLASSKGVKVIVYESPGYSGIFKTQSNRKEMLDQIRYDAEGYRSTYWIFDQLPLGDKKVNFICPLIMNSEASRVFMDTLSLRINKLR
ncbi:MAG: hypothetical protein ACKOXB_08055 [Flavobacteriales bacterium]